MPAFRMKRIWCNVQNPHDAGLGKIQQFTLNVDELPCVKKVIFRAQMQPYCGFLISAQKYKMTQTEQQFDAVVAHCRSLYEKKMQDYGSAWRILRLPSLTDQIFIKAQRIRSIENKGTQKVADSIEGEFIGILNYSVMALVQLERGVAEQPDLSLKEALAVYDVEMAETKALMMAKNHDYGEAWREMRISSYTDLILQKLLRIKQIEDNAGKTLVSEGLEANYRDMINYSVFALIKFEEARG